MTIEEIYTIVDKTPFENWMTKEDCMVLNKYASEIKGNILEIGAWAGRSGVCLSLSSPESKIYSIDNLSEKTESSYEHKVGEPTIQLNINVSKYPNWTLYVGDSVEVSKTWEIPLDLLIIDGAHDYESCVNDIIHWVPFLKKDHILLMHDQTHIPDVKKAVDRYLRIRAEQIPTELKTQYGIFRI